MKSSGSTIAPQKIRAIFIKKLKKYTESVKVDFKTVKEYIKLYPDKVYKNIYEGGLMGELV